MRIYFLAVVLLVLIADRLPAQRSCASFDYLDRELAGNPLLKSRVDDLENFVRQKLMARTGQLAGKPHAGTIIRIPVVVHILYHNASENISDEKVFSQIQVLNESFRRLHADTINTPDAFKPIAADCGIEFQLAIADPQRRATTGIIRKYTAVERWNADDQMKYSSQTGSDAWDPGQYLNIWVCNLDRVAGYSSFPGGPADKDGIVIAFNVFGKNKKAGYDMGKTAVHEAGHWMGLRHIWGDSYCGDDWVDDTPKQGNFTPGCPAGIRPSCSNGSQGDMYMNYMDLTQDACINLFTEGQKARMRTLFEKDGARYAMLKSVGLQPPLINEIPLPEEAPKWLHPQLYPNPATSELTLDLSYDTRWIGHTIVLFNTQGQFILQETIKSKVARINISALKPGLYFLQSKRDDGATIKQKFVKI